MNMMKKTKMRMETTKSIKKIKSMKKIRIKTITTKSTNISHTDTLL